MKVIILSILKFMCLNTALGSSNFSFSVIYPGKVIVKITHFKFDIKPLGLKLHVKIVKITHFEFYIKPLGLKLHVKIVKITHFEFYIKPLGLKLHV